MNDDSFQNVPRAKFLRMNELRARWGGMALSTIYYRMKHCQIPQPKYPFGPTTPYWDLSEVEAFESRPTANKDEATEKARLVASAPDLLEALKATVSQIIIESKAAGTDAEGWDCIIQARAAISKATGRSSS